MRGLDTLLLNSTRVTGYQLLYTPSRWWTYEIEIKITKIFQLYTQSI